MKKYAITGNIASGKSAVQKIIAKQGYKVIDADDISHKLLTVKNLALYYAFKDYDVFENNEFSREKLGQLIFSDAKMRIKLNTIIHPCVKKEIEKFFADNAQEELLFVGIPLLFEANMQDLFDKIIFVYTDDDIRLKRLLKRNNHTIEHAKARMNSQITQEKKLKLSDYVINNNSTITDLQNNVIKLLKLL